MALISYIGATVAVFAGKPATVDAAGFSAAGMTYIKVGKITQWGEIGDTSEDVTETTLEGRTLHVNGALDGGAVDFTFITDGTDAGQTLLKTKSGTNDDISVKITDPDGEVNYICGKVANVRSRERTPSTMKGMSGQFRINSPVITVPAT